MANSSFNLSDLNGSNGFVINGIDEYDNSGYSVSSAGDVNGDGFDDIIIGASSADPNGNSYAGETYVVFGKAAGFAAGLDLSSLDGSNGFVINGIDNYDWSGDSVSSAGDVNGDGFDDIIIGATGADPNGNSYAGETYVVFGKAAGFAASLDLSSLDGSNGFILNGIDSYDNSGFSVSSAGDVNGDGFDDLIIGASSADPNGNSYAGESYVVFGKAAGFAAGLDLSSLDGSNGFVINGIDNHDRSGRPVSSAGDINGDGFDDIIIGADSADPNGNSYAGESYVVFGKAAGFAAGLDLSSLDGSNGFILNGIDEGDRSGRSVSGAGDVNGDGFDDIIIGARFADPNGNGDAGETYVVFGSNAGFGGSLDLSSLDGSNGFVINGIDNYDRSGRSVSSAGDINGDGFDDIIIGADSADPNGNNGAGKSYVVFGSNAGFAGNLDLSSLDGSNGFVINGIDNYDNSGGSVSSAGDVNGDGFDDIIIGARSADPNGNNRAGESYVIFGNAAPLFDLNGRESGVDDTVTETFLGTTLNLINTDTTFLNDDSGILNAITLTLMDAEDGIYERLTVDTRGTNITSNYPSNTAVMTLSGEDSVDNYLQVLRSLQYQNIANSPTGATRSIDIVVDDGDGGVFTSQTATLNFNIAQAPTGINLPNINGFVINGIDEGDNSGFSVSSAGDFNGDGIDDLLIGAPFADPNGNSGAGESYVVFGKTAGFAASLDLSSLDGSNGFILNGIDEDDRSGGFVSNAGDINGDGIDDIIIGARNGDPNGNSLAGESYIVFGKTGGFAASLDLSSLDGSNGFILNGIDSGDFSGFSVSSVGDINGDGIDDLIIGARGANGNGNNNAGESYVVFGKTGGFAASLDLSSLDGSNGFVINGIDENDSSGYSVSSAGDVNGDGFDDLIIGARNADPNGNNNAGESYVVFGSDTGFAASLDLSSLDGNNGFVLNGIDEGDESGRSVSGAGDFNGDGFDDIIIGARLADPNGNDSAGESYVVFGSNAGFAASFDLSSLDGNNGFVLNGIDEGNRSGGFVSGAGDVNGDGFDDIIIGARFADPNGNDSAGNTYVVFGSDTGFAASFDLSSLDGSNGFIINGIDENDYSGHSVSGAGDINGDGFDDLIIGARLADPNGNSSAGESYVILGGSSFNATIELANITFATVNENSPNGTIVSLLNTEDLNIEDTHTYTLIDDAGGRFVLNGNQVIVADGSLLDFESNISHDIIVRTTDRDGLSFQDTLTINIIDLVVENIAPSQLTFSTDKSNYNFSEDVQLTNAWIYDENGASDLALVNFWVRTPDGEWIDVNDVSSFNPWQDDTKWGNFTYNLDLEQFRDKGAGTYTIWGEGEDISGEKSNIVENTFEIDNVVVENMAPDQLTFSTDKSSYDFSEDVQLTNAWIYDENGSSDIALVDFWVRTPDGEWIDVNDVSSFNPWESDNKWGSFTYNLDLEQFRDKGTGTYTIWGEGEDNNGEKSNIIQKTFEITNNTQFLVQSNAEDNIIPSPTGLDGYFDIDAQVYTSNDTLHINNGWVRDLNGVSDIQRIDFWLRKEGEGWQDIEDISRNEITPWQQDTTWGSFDYNLDLTGLTPGSYTLWSGVQDQELANNGTWANIVENTFEIQA